MKLFHIHKRFLLMMNAISILVAFLMHLPELIALSEPEAGSRLFPDVHWANVSYEILFTYLSTVLLFFLNIGMMRLNKPAAELSWLFKASYWLTRFSVRNCSFSSNMRWLRRLWGSK